MGKLELIRALFDYHAWADDRLLDAAAGLNETDLTREADIPFGSAQDNLLHILGSQVSWVMRLTGEAPPLAKVEQGRVVVALRESFSAAHVALGHYLGTLTAEDLDKGVRVVEFSSPDNAEPHPLERPLWEILLSVGTHGISHRSEVAAVLTSRGSSPEQLDYSEFAWRHAMRPSNSDADSS